MPIYEYKCGKCGVVEVMQRITETPLKKCPRCKSKVERQISRGSFILKGSGWYATDYAKKGTSNGADAAPAPSAATDGNSTAASTTDTTKKPPAESKPASTETKTSSEKSTAAKAAD